MRMFTPTLSDSARKRKSQPMNRTISMLIPFLLALLLSLAAGAQRAEELVIVRDGKTTASVVVAAEAGTWERRAAEDLVKYIHLMSGARPGLVTRTAGAALPAGTAIVVGRAALEAEPGLNSALAAAAKRNPLIRADVIVMRRAGERVYLAGSNDEAHYFAAAQLLQDWGCRWYLPTDFGECIPEQPTLTVGKLDRAYGSPFEIRHYWLSWNGDATGANEFRRRNFMTETSMAGMGHALGKYTEKLAPPGKTVFHVPLAEEATAAQVAAQIEAEYARGVEGISLAIEDGNYTSDSPRDKELQAGIYDKYALQPSNTDGMMTLYNNVAKILRARHPGSKTKIGGMAYANVTLPPQWVTTIESNVVMWLAPIDIDPNHGMDDPDSPPRQEYREMLYRWAELMKGRLAIYDYDQGQLVWRDLPNPSHHAFGQDVKHYRKAGILGVGTESRGAMATTFLNLFFRGQLMWNPDADVKALLAEFYPKFYGPAAGPMAEYWSGIFEAWEKTLSTEHEHFVAPVVYTPELVASLKEKLAEAQQRVAPLRSRADLSRNEKQYLERMEFTALGFEVLDSYMAMVRAAAGEADYKAAAAAGERGLAAREKLTAMNPTFTTYKQIGETGAAWWPGEVAHMRDLLALTDGSRGTLLARMPLEWAFRRDPRDTGLPRGWAYKEGDLAFWNARGKSFAPEARKDYPDEWEMLRTDTYLQGQGVRHPDRQSYTGHYWYQTTLDLKAEQAAGRVRLMFPGLFNECWLYVNGQLAGHRAFPEPWWKSDYRFQWDVDLAGRVKAGRNTFTLRGFNPHHFGGMFRRPVLYRQK
jgi:uncharacterized protein DUF4838